MNAPRRLRSIAAHLGAILSVGMPMLVGTASGAPVASEPRNFVFSCDGGAGLTPDENRVVDWTVERILQLAGNDAGTIDITPESIAAGTGVNVESLDTERVRDAVTLRLVQLVGGGATTWTPEPPPQPGAAAESSCTGVGEAPVEAGGGPAAAAAGRASGAQSSRR